MLTQLDNIRHKQSVEISKKREKINRILDKSDNDRKTKISKKEPTPYEIS
jgi:hypothetical protein